MGNAGLNALLSNNASVHPRMRGERWQPRVNTFRHSGSSPHAWGTLKYRFDRSCRDRFIPACVGNAKGIFRPGNNRAVHPRMRGERLLGAVHRARAAGSSPHAWGTPWPPRVLLDGRRFIPACVGNAISSAAPRSSKTVHPRMRGERAIFACFGGRYSGSSPHAWGTPRARDWQLIGRRFIPACVGNALRGTV